MSAYMDPAAGFGGGLARAQINNPRARPRRSAPKKTARRAGETVEQWLERQWREYSASQTNAINEQRRLYEEELNRQYQARIARGQALAQAIQSMGFDKAIQGAYSNAGHDLAGLASGFAGSTREIANAEAAAQMNMLSGTGQEGAVRNEGAAMGDVAYGVGGWIPGRSLGETGAALAADAAMQPNFTLQQSGLEAERQRQEGEAGLLDFAKMLAEVQAGKYEFKENMRQQRSQARDEDRKYRFEMLKWQADQHYRNYMLALERGDQKLAMKEYNLAVRKQKQAEREAQRDYELDLRESGRQDRELELKAAGGTKKNVTPTQARDSMKDVVNATGDVTKAVENAIRSGQWKPSAGRSKQRKALVDRLFRDFSYLALTPAARQRLKQIIMKAVKEAGRVGPTAPSAGSSSSPGGYEDYK